MDPSRLRDLLAVLRDAGVASADLHDGTDRVCVSFSPVAPASSTVVDGPPAVLHVPDEDLPPGAYDPIARRRAAKAAT